MQFVWKWKLHTENFFHKRGGRLPPGGGGRTVRGLSLLRANEALTSDLVTLQSVRLAQSSQDATSLAGFGNICRFSTICEVEMKI